AVSSSRTTRGGALFSYRHLVLSLRRCVLNGLLSPAPEVFTGATYVPTKVLTGTHNAAMLHVFARACAGPFHLTAALLHLPFCGVGILLRGRVRRSQG